MLRNTQNAESTGNLHTPSRPRDVERTPLREADGVGGVGSYGSILGSPQPERPPSLALPDPALDPSEATFDTQDRQSSRTPAHRDRHGSIVGDAFHVGRTQSPQNFRDTLRARGGSLFRPRRTYSTPGAQQSSSAAERPLIKRLFTGPPTPKGTDVPLEAYREFDLQQKHFFGFLDDQLRKIETFYREKEEEATCRLRVLRDQLHVMRDRRLEELYAAERAKEHRLSEVSNGKSHGNGKANGNGVGGSAPLHKDWMKPLGSVITGGGAKIGKTTKSLVALTSPHGPQGVPLAAGNDKTHPEARRDYTRRPEAQDVSYRSAKRKLKLALQEYYRGLELLKSYALLNRTAFRKINKKYDKAVNARPTGRYMAEKVNKAWFVQSDVIDGHIVAVEDLYARYFERGNHKVAVGKLRRKAAKSGDYSGNIFRNGLMLAAGAVFGIEGLVYAAEKLFVDDQVISTQTSYLLQVGSKISFERDVVSMLMIIFDRYTEDTSSCFYCSCYSASIVESGVGRRSTTFSSLSLIPGILLTGGSCQRCVHSSTSSSEYLSAGTY